MPESFTKVYSIWHLLPFNRYLYAAFSIKHVVYIDISLWRSEDLKIKQKKDSQTVILLPENQSAERLNQAYSTSAREISDSTINKTSSLTRASTAKTGIR